MAYKLFVGGLSWDTTEMGLRDIFSSFGEVIDARVITDRDTGRSRGFGFVTFASQDEGMQAMQELDGSTLDGRAIRVNEATEPRRDGGGGGGFGGGGGGGGFGGGGGGFGGGGGGGSRGGGRGGGRGGRSSGGGGGGGQRREKW